MREKILSKLRFLILIDSPWFDTITYFDNMYPGFKQDKNKFTGLLRD